MHNLDNKKIVVVDDDPEMLEILEGKLAHAGCKVLVSDGGIESVDMIGNEKPDLIILDVMMPKMTGMEIKEKLNENKLTADIPERLRRSRSWVNIPVIFLTGKDLTVDKTKGIELGAEAYITKPFELDKLVDVISSILK